MQTYARVQDGRVAEVIKVPANTPPLVERFHPDLIPSFVELSTSQAKKVAEGWVYDGTEFAAPPEPPALRVRSVFPVAFRKAARATSHPDGGNILQAMLAATAEDEEAHDAIEFAVKFERADLIEGGMPAELADTVLALAATYPGSGAVMEPVD